MITPLFLSPARSSRSTTCPSGRRSLAQINPLYHCVELVRDAVFGCDGWTDLGHVAVLVGFGRCVAHGDPRMQRKLVD